ncbi:Uncharacterized protein TCM_023393 [Theobroma cacao]|uniref:Uncharacterized protein n=1 Tax=Theobroma cacao TaxID=3641 RepID=A0A061EU50_THECC|nr:Uncharacterized protein TCM_023393 [Theobroma cacao]
MTSVQIPQVRKKARLELISAGPPMGLLKFNVDSAASGSSGGGNLRDGKGLIKVMFSKSIGIDDFNFNYRRSLY